MATAGLSADPPVPPGAFAFPRDHGAHEAYGNEWWRCVGHLQARDGRRFDYAVTFFRFAVGSPSALRDGANAWKTRDFYPATLTLVDERSGRSISAERFARDTFDLGAARSDRLGLQVIDWSLDGNGARDSRSERLTLHVGDGTTDLTLRAVSQKPAVSFGGGIVRRGPCTTCLSHEYALTSLRTDGFVTTGGEHVAVTGTSWFDHSYGSHELARDELGWDRFSVTLDDGREIWIDATRTADGRYAPGTHALIVERDGKAHELPAAAYRLGGFDAAGWRSRKTGVRYPNLWALTIPSAGLMLSLETVVADQEVVAGLRGVAYWNGAVDVFDVTPGTPGKRLGAGYVELTGYARPLRL
ncbi:MAG: hypothetical protein IAI50_16525 [Candidatus Eremiobacteraeota bacterium]|nr:hypothetical protein [Candidatus Eremiobacteraeota bacterium]